MQRFKRSFPEKGCIFYALMLQILKVILRDRCSTSDDSASIFPGRRNIFEALDIKKPHDLMVRRRELPSQHVENAESITPALAGGGGGTTWNIPPEGGLPLKL